MNCKNQTTKLVVAICFAMLIFFGMASAVFAESSSSTDCTVKTLQELKQALADHQSEIKISGMIEISEKLDIEGSVIIRGADKDSGLYRSSGYSDVLLEYAGKQTSTEIVIDQLKIDGKKIGAAASAVSVQGADLTITDSVFENCQASSGKNASKAVNGAALNVKNSKFTITGCSFEGNSNSNDNGALREKSGNGGALFMEGCNGTIKESAFSHNTLSGSSVGDGIAAYLENGTYTIQNTKMNENSSEKKADGTLYMAEGDGTVHVTVKGSEFCRNDTRGYGGGLGTPYNGDVRKNNRIIEISDSSLSKNTADDEGGGAVLAGSKVTIKNSHIDHNTNIYQAGGMVIYMCDAEIIGSSISSNVTTKGCSGGIHNWSSAIQMTDTDVCYNTAKNEGGGMCVYGPDYDDVKSDDGKYHIIKTNVIFNGGNISHNKTTGPAPNKDDYSYQSNGGGIFVHTGGTFVFNDGVIEGNESVLHGGGVYVNDTDYVEKEEKWNNGTFVNFSGRFIMNGGIICDNKAAESGGGVYLSDVKRYTEKIDLDNSDSASFKMNEGTIRNNTAGKNGGGVFVEYAEMPCTFDMDENAFVFDNKAGAEESLAGDDICDETKKPVKEVNAKYPAREFADILQENCWLTAIDDHEIPEDLKVPFVSWYVDEAMDSKGVSHRFKDLNSPVPAKGQLNATAGLKAIWGGYLLLYDANDGTGKTQYASSAYRPGEDAAVSDLMFSAPSGKKFAGWNTKPDGSGTSYAKDADLKMDQNQILYAQYSDISDPAADPSDPNQDPKDTSGNSETKTKTGDTATPELWAVLCGLALTGAVMTVVYRKRRVH